MDQRFDPARDIGHAVIKSVPPVTVWAVTLNEWVAIASIAYIAVQTAYLIWKWRREAVSRRLADDA